MPIYYFDVWNDVQGASEDQVGTELSDATQARQEAVHLVGTLIADDARKGCSVESWRVEVTDHAGTALFSLDFVIRPALEGTARHLPFTPIHHRHGVAAR